MAQVISTFAIAIGFVIMLISTVQSCLIVRRNRQETYGEFRNNPWLDVICLCLMFLFDVGYIVGFLHVLTPDLPAIYHFVSFIFFFGAVYVFLIIRWQTRMLVQLRGKSMEVMKAFVSAIEMKDYYTKGHSQHVYDITALFLDELESFESYPINRPKLLDAALLHDIGKISIADIVLNKSGTLSEEEWAIIKEHPQKGKIMLDDTCFQEIGDWVLYHHERVDGTGYYGLPGDRIPLESRIISIADTYSALCTNRVYRDALSHEDSLAIMQEVAGAQLDKKLFACFRRIDAAALKRVLPTDADASPQE